jgi:hypothetical protein
VKLQSREMLSLSPRKRASVFTPHSGTRRDIHRQVRRVKNVPLESFTQIQTVVMPEVGPQSPAILPKEVREA